MTTKSFSFNTVRNFDDHIRKSIPDYNGLYHSVIKISDYFVTQGTKVYDLGTSTGRLLLDLRDRASHANIEDIEFIGIENESNFFKYHDESLENVRWIHEDLVKYNNWRNASYITSIFTLQFIKPCQRLPVLKRIYEASNPGSAFVFSEKVYSDYAHIQDINTFLYYDWKSQNFNTEEILDKEKSLRSMMRLRTKDAVENEVKKSGWKICDTFWQQHNFVAWIAIKEG